MKIDMKFSHNETYAEATAILRVKEKYFLTDSAISRILDADTVEETIRLLSQNSSCDFKEDTNPTKMEDTLYSCFIRACESINHLCPDPYIVDLIMQKYLFHNKKVESKLSLTKEKEGPFYSIENVSDYSTPIDEDIKNPQVIDMLWDKEMYKVLLAMSNELNNDYIKDYYQMDIDFYNVRLLLRAKNMKKPLSRMEKYFVEGGHTDLELLYELYDMSYQMINDKLFYEYYGEEVKSGLDTFSDTGNLGVLEKYLDNLLIEQIKKSRYIAFGPEIPFSYLLCKENEIGQIRLLTSGKLNQIDDDIIRERLRDSYA